MIRNLNSITDDTQAVTEIVGIILMITIVIVAATAIHVSMGQINDSNIGTFTIVTMLQSGNYISITDVQNGPVSVDDTIINVLDSTGSSTGLTGTLNALGTNVALGDIVTMSGVVSGESYTVQIILKGRQVGVAKYIAP